MATHILDASAVLALMAGEPGSARVQDLLRADTAAISAVNLSEVAAKLISRGAGPAQAELACRSLGLEMVAAGPEIAFRAAAMTAATQPLGLSLGDRICLATAEFLGIPAVTADRAWASIPGAAVEVIR